jgi:hypothetical protein
MNTVTESSSAKPLRRAPWSKKARWLGLALAYVMWPVVKLFELFGAWPRVLTRGMQRMMKEGARAYHPCEHDVLVCSYFKTGTNWTMQIAVQIAYRGRAEFEHIHDVVPWLEMPERNRFTVPLADENVWRNTPTGRRVIKTHCALDELWYDPRAKYICVVRDPKDVFVSSYHFMRSSMLGPLMATLPRWLDTFLSDDAMCGPWARHLAAAWSARGRENVLFLTYEEMKADLPSAVRRIAELMGVALTEAELEAVVERSSYAYMKSIGEKFDPVGLSPPWAKARGSMVRRGERGSASELLSVADQKRIDDYCRASLRALECDFPYDEAFGAQRPARA